MRLLLTGSASHLARVLLPRLCADARISEVVGVDLRASGYRHPCFTEHRLDVRDRRVADHMAGCDAVVHMAFVVIPRGLGRGRHDRELIRDINIGGSRNIAERARAAGVRHFIHLSSAAVYGAWPDNPERLDEGRPRRANPGFAYAEDKRAVEDWLDDYEQTATAPRLVRLRPHVILGPRAQPLLRFLLRQPTYPRLPDPQPLTQCVWEGDVVEAILAAVFSPHRGAFNLGAEPALPFREMIRHCHRRSLGLPYALWRTVHRGVWRFTGAFGEPGWMEGMHHSLAVDSSRAQRELGWRPRDTFACLDAALGRG